MEEILEEIARKYRQLLLAISTRYGRESNHETALRFIKERIRQEKEDQVRKTINRNKPFDWQSVFKK